MPSSGDVRYFRVRNQSKLQHYKTGDRARTPPPWIKWHLSCLTSYAFTQLTDAQRWHAVGLALLASQQDNHLPADPRWLARELSASGRINLVPLLEAGFIEWCECAKCNGHKVVTETNASNVLAAPASNLLAPVEKRRGEETREEERPPPAPSGRGVGGNGNDGTGDPPSERALGGAPAGSHPRKTEEDPEVVATREQLRRIRESVAAEEPGGLFSKVKRKLGR